MKNSIKKAQSQACLGFAEQKNFRPLAKLKKLSLTLALLLMAVGGAWATDDVLLVTINNRDYTTFKSGSMTFDDKVTITFSNTVKNDGDNWGWYAGAGGATSLLTVAGINGYTITSCKFYVEINGIAKTGYTIEGESPSVYLFNGVVYTDASKSVKIGTTGITKIEVYGTAPSSAPDVEVTTNAASEGATFTEASFEMPTYDVDVDYELVRDMSVQMQAQVGDGTQEQPRYRVKKDNNNKFIPADMEMAAVPALFTVNDAIEQKALTQTQDYIVQIYAIDAEGQPTGEAMTFANFTFEPGIYAVKAVAATGSDYDGETALSNTFQLFQGYEITVPAGEYVTYYKDEPLYADAETSADAQLYTITSVSADQAVLSAAIETAPSLTPLLIFNSSDQTKTFLLIPANEEPNHQPTVAPEFHGTLTATTIAASTDAQSNYALNGKQFVFVKDAIEIGPNKAWLSIPTAISNARALTIVFPDETTKITTTNLTNLTNGDWYDLNGRKLNGMPTKKGVYIMNGRKVVVK